MLRRITLATTFSAALSAPVDAAPISPHEVRGVDAIVQSQAGQYTWIFDEFSFGVSTLFQSVSEDRSRGVPFLSAALVTELASNAPPMVSSPSAAAATVHYIKFALGASVGDVLKFVKRPPVVPAGGGGAPDADMSGPAPDDDPSGIGGQGSSGSQGEWTNPADVFPDGLESDSETDDFPIATGGLTEGAVGYASVGVAPIPEPASVMLLLTGAAVATFRQRAKRRAQGS